MNDFGIINGNVDILAIAVALWLCAPLLIELVLFLFKEPESVEDNDGRD